MPWKVTDPMCERAKFVALYDEGLFSMSELCQRFGVSSRFAPLSEELKLSEGSLTARPALRRKGRFPESRREPLR